MVHPVHIEEKKKGKETEEGENISRRHGLSNASDRRARQAGQFIKGEEKMKGTRDALELRTREGRVAIQEKNELLGVVNTVCSTALRFGITGLHYYAHFARGLQ